MPLTQVAKNEIRDLAECFVGAFVKCGAPGSRFTVKGEPCDSIEVAVSISLGKCRRPSVAWLSNAEEKEEALRNELETAIKNLRCG